MKWLLLVMVVFVAAGAGLVYAAHTGIDELPGSYSVASSGSTGTAEITGTRLTLRLGESEYTGEVKLSAARTTEPVKLQAASGPEQGREFSGVARFVRGELTLVLAESGAASTEISATGDGIRRIVLSKTGASFLVRAGRTLGGIVANLGNPDAWKSIFERPEVYWPAVAVLALIIFAETGLLVGFFLPGDSLLVTVGIVARVVEWDIVPLLLILSFAAILGDTIGYWVGAKGGPAIFNRPESRWFKQEHLNSARAFFDRHGGKTLVIARFMPFARTFVPVVAGAARMNYTWFLTYNVIGGIAWIVSMLMFGYTATSWLDPLLKSVFGNNFKLEKNIDILAIVIILLSLAPMVIHWLVTRGKKAEVATPTPPAPTGV